MPTLLRPRLIALAALLAAALLPAQPRRQPLALLPTDVLPTGNEWISLPDIRSMRDRGLIQVSGAAGGPVIEPYFAAAGQPIALHNPSWELLEYWIPTAHQTIDSLDLTLTWCAPPGSRAAFLRLTVTNRRSAPVEITLGARASFGAISRVTYLPVALHMQRTVAEAPWVSPGEAFSAIDTDTRFAWSLIHPGAQGHFTLPPLSTEPATDASRTLALAPGATAEQLFILGAGVEEFSAAHAARALRELLDRNGADGLLTRAAAWCARRTRTTGLSRSPAARPP